MTSEYSSPGQIITFYSYKGGTGRSMALANIACLLAQRSVKGESILMIDWDLEAPGLHHFFHGRFIKGKSERRNLPNEQLGLIDLFYEMHKKLLKSGIQPDSYESFFDDLGIEKYIIELRIPSLNLMPAGKSSDGSYSTRVSLFNWEEFFNNYPFLINQFANYLQKRFKFTLIDSRTGYTDISGICTSLMPEKLVVVFTPNRQSLEGVVELVRKSTDYRKQSDDLRPLVVFPLASRIENAESKLQHDWRFGNSEEGITGYQSQFEAVLKDVYNLPGCDLTSYFDQVQLQYSPRYSYGEDIAVLSERKENRLSIGNSYESFLERLVYVEHPWDEIESQEQATPGLKDLNTREREILRLVGRGLTDREIARQLSISENTIAAHLRNIFGKLNVRNRTAAVAQAVIVGIIKKEDLDLSSST